MTMQPMSNLYNITIKITDDGTQVRASHKGKALRMTDKTTAMNVAGILSRVAAMIPQHFSSPSSASETKDDNEEARMEMASSRKVK